MNAIREMALSKKLDIQQTIKSSGIFRKGGGTNGATIFSINTFNIKTFSVKTLSIKTFSIKTFSIKTFSIKTFSIKTLSIMTISILTLSLTTLHTVTPSLHEQYCHSRAKEWGRLGWN
jgi:hypothetical protein